MRQNSFGHAQQLSKSIGCAPRFLLGGMLAWMDTLKTKTKSARIYYEYILVHTRNTSIIEPFLGVAFWCRSPRGYIVYSLPANSETWLTYTVYDTNSTTSAVTLDTDSKPIRFNQPYFLVSINPFVLCTVCVLTIFSNKRQALLVGRSILCVIA